MSRVCACLAKLSQERDGGQKVSGTAPFPLAQLPAGFPRALPQCKPSLSWHSLCPLTKGQFVGKGSGQLLFTESKHLWHIIYACIMLICLPPIQETLHLREVLKQLHPDLPKHLQISPLVLRRYSLLIISNPPQQKIILHPLTMERHNKTF